MPVSSQEVSMPRTSGSSAIQLPLHHDRVGAVVVVAPTQSDLLEPELQIDRPGARIVGVDLQDDLHGREPARLGQQRGQQRAADPATLPGLQHGDRLDVGLVGGGGQPRVTDDPPLRFGHEVVPGPRLVGELTPDHALAPGIVGERRPLDLHDRGHIGLGHQPNQRPIALYGVRRDTVVLYGVRRSTVALYGLRRSTVVLYGVRRSTVALYGVRQAVARVHGVTVAEAHAVT